MTAFDTDVMSDILRGRPDYVSRVGKLPAGSYAVPVVVAGEILDGRLAAVRLAESGRGRLTLEQAYRLFDDDLRRLPSYWSLPYTPTADALFLAWRSAKVRVGSKDLRIAAVCQAHGYELATRNARDFGLIPNFAFQIWS